MYFLSQRVSPLAGSSGDWDIQDENKRWEVGNTMPKLCRISIKQVKIGYPEVRNDKSQIRKCDTDIWSL